MVKLLREGALALLTLDRPEALNALSFAVIRDIGAAIDEAAGWDIRALILTGTGEKAFCAGADIKELVGRSLMDERAGSELGQRVFAKLDSFKVPSIAAINGYAFGGGLELAMACTFRVASSKARVGLPEIKLGLIPGYGGTQRLPRLVGEARAAEIALTGRTIDAEEALAIGLVNRLADGDVVEAAKAFAAEFTGYGLPALALARAAVRRALDVPLDEGLRVEADLSTLAYRTEDAAEGLTAFIEKRKPQFRDK
ncbi:enoyl-CoA hydratase/isomerase family protein [Pseudochelatococcus lubricantis]|uniref:enoyl-CoA hydratase/isomerase family protein n=1 Tax=Pseudochelatococcus lubricantis TaxID=1538102 RepID=UPI0035E47DCB